MTARNKLRLCSVIQVAALFAAAKSLYEMIGRLWAEQSPVLWGVLLLVSVVVGIAAALLAIYFKNQIKTDESNQQKVAVETLSSLAKSEHDHRVPPK